MKFHKNKKLGQMTRTRKMEGEGVYKEAVGRKRRNEKILLLARVRNGLRKEDLTWKKRGFRVEGV